MRVFGSDEIDYLFTNSKEAMRSEVRAEEDKNLLNVNEVKYVDYLVKRFSIEPLKIDFDGVTATDRFGDVGGFQMGPGADVRAGRSYERQIIRIHLPYSGDGRLFQYSPYHAGGPITPELNLGDQEIWFEVINASDRKEEVRREIERHINGIRQAHDLLLQKVDEFNAGLEDIALTEVKSRKQQILQRSEFLESLGVPIKRSSSTPRTFSIPAVRKPLNLDKPESTDRAYAPEPTLNEDIYQDILEICRDVGVVIERHPQLYEGKDEEGLRDYFLLVLSPHFEFAGGETFNKTGKTDILVRHQGKNAFVAECKFWKGIKAFSDALDQLLGYLTWRDSKTALIVFIKNKELNPVLEQIRDKTHEHPCHVKSEAVTRDGQFDFHFHLPRDESRGVRVAVLCFHFP